ncbi:FecR domain-containing protein [Alphaproteobacteria bacterium]|jgi:trimeric autotransporter adhesin|nr:FecR domain-containing protein [Alphaproteobacteria bacterium]
MATLSTRTAKLAATTALCSLIGLSGIVGSSALAREAGVAAAVNTDATSIPPAQVERTLIVGNKLVFQETVKTSPNGQAQLLMMDQSAVTVGPNSQLVIDKFVYDPDKRTGEMALSLSRGLMRFVGGRISKSGGVKIRTPVATMGIRGGIALIEVINEKTVDETLLYGAKLQARQRADRTSKSVAKAFSHASKWVRHQQIL